MLTSKYKELKKNDRYEILALLRESMKKNGNVEFILPERTLSCQFLHIDLKNLSIAYLEDLHSVATPVEVVIKGRSERISFTTRKSETECQTGTLLYDFPIEITITQRRSLTRIAIDESYNFFCEGRFRDDFNYKLRIKDLSRDGIGLLYQRPLPELTRSGILLKNMIIHLGKWDSYPVDLMFSDIKEITSFDNEHNKIIYYIISCRFQKPSKSFNRKIEGIIMEILLEQKKIKRLR